MTPKPFRGLDSRGLRTIYGIHPVSEALKADRTVHELLVKTGGQGLAKQVDPKRRAKTVKFLPPEALAKLAGSEHHQGVVARTDPLGNASLNHLVRTKGEALFVLLLDGVQDPQNLGAVIRVADCVGVDLVVVPAHDAASVQLGSVAKASAGAIEHVNLLVVADLKTVLDEMKEHGFTRLGLEAEEGESLMAGKPKFPLALVLGGEDRGIKTRVRAACDRLVHLPMHGRVNSLNVSAAAAAAAFWVRSAS